MIGTVSRSVRAEVPVQVSPHSVAVHPSQPLVANGNYDSNSFTVINVDSPTGVAVTPDGRYCMPTSATSTAAC